MSMFTCAPELRHNDMRGQVLDGRQYIALSEHPDERSLMFTVAEARDLRDWLNKVLP